MRHRTDVAILLLLPVLAIFPAAAQKTVYVSPDVPTDPGIGIDVLPWEVVRHNAGVYGPPLPELAIPGNPAVDALHKMDKPGNWLFSVEAPSTLGGLFPNYVEPRDVVRVDLLLGAYTFFFCGRFVTGAVPLTSNVDALFVVGADTGDLVVSFDVPTTIGATTFLPADLARYVPTGAGGCAGWQLAGKYFDSTLAGTGIPLSSNLIGADESSGRLVLAFDVPTDLSPSAGPPTYVPGDLVAWDGLVVPPFSLFDTLGGWPLASHIEALSCQANPGRVYERTVYPFPINMAKSQTTPGNVVLSWAPSCSSGAEDYGIYEGTLGTWYSHVRILCSDVTLGPYDEDFTPQAADSYYLVVPHNFKDEGAYGEDYFPQRIPPRAERPQPVLPGNRCTPTQVVTACP